MLNASTSEIKKEGVQYYPADKYVSFDVTTCRNVSIYLIVKPGSWTKSYRVEINSETESRIYKDGVVKGRSASNLIFL